MKLILHDLNNNQIKKLHFNESDKIVNSLNCKNNCIGCFNCWIKHPMKCSINDNYNNLVSFLNKSDEFIIISKSIFGCYSSNAKKVLERLIGYVDPRFTIRNNEIHHKSRKNKNIKFSVYFYGNISEKDKEILSKLVKANSINLNTKNYNIKFCKNISEVIKCIH